MPINTKRIYDPPTKADGQRILVDRLWPRGIKKENAHIDLWLKDVAPSTELRKWFHANLDQWPKFKKQYTAELKANPTPLNTLKQLATTHPTITLLYASTNTTHNHAQILRDLLAKR